MQLNMSLTHTCQMSIKNVPQGIFFMLDKANKCVIIFLGEKMSKYFDYLLEKTKAQFEGKAREEKVEMLRSKGCDEDNINYILDGKLTKKLIKKIAKKGRIGEHQVLLARDERSEILKVKLLSLPAGERVQYLMDCGLDEEFATRVAGLVQEIENSKKTID